MAATRSSVRGWWLVVASGLTDHSLNIAQTTCALRIGALAFVQPLGALGFDVRRNAGRSGFPDFLLNRCHRMLETITDQPPWFSALLKNGHAYFQAGEDVTGSRVEIRHVAGGRGAKAEALQ